MYLVDTQFGHLYSIYITALRFSPIQSMELEILTYVS